MQHYHAIPHPRAIPAQNQYGIEYRDIPNASPHMPSHTLRGAFQGDPPSQPSKKIIVDRYLMQPIYQHTVKDIITSEEETTHKIEIKTGILGNKRCKNGTRTKRKMQNLSKRYFKGLSFANGDIKHDSYRIHRKNNYKIDEEYEKKLFYPVGYSKLQVKSTPGTTDDTMIALHPTSRRCKRPCGADIDTIIHYLKYIKSSTLNTGTDHETRHNFLKRNAKMEWCYKKDLFKKMFPNINSYKMVEKRSYLPILTSIMDVAYLCYAERYDRGSSNVDPKHYLYPVLFVKCPSHTMGGSCTKWVNLAFIMYQLILHDNKDMLNWIDIEFAPFLCKHLMPNTDKVVVNEQQAYTHGWNSGIVTAPYTQQKHIRGEPDPVKQTKKLQFIVHYVECQHCAEMRQHHYSIGIQYANTKKCFIGTRCSNCSCVICTKCGYNHTRQQKCKTRPYTDEVTEDEIHSVQAALAETNTLSTKCPSCDLLHLKDDACDKVQCSCGTKFCFRCSEDLAHYDNYMDHLIVAMKSDGTNTHWICKKFAKPCPECTRLQLWDSTANGNEITCGACQTVFTVET